MRVADMLKDMVYFGVSGDQSPEYVEDVYLRYINRAHEELYNYTASFNDDLVFKEIIATTAGSTTVQLAYTPFSMRTVYTDTSTVSLNQCSSDMFEKYQIEYNNSGYPSVYRKTKNQIDIYPIQTQVSYNLSIRYIPPPPVLSLATNEIDIPYPPSYHYVLVKGALRYVFMDEEGFNSTQKSEDNNKLWLTGKQDLISYLVNTSRETIGTFTNV